MERGTVVQREILFRRNRESSCNCARRKLDFFTVERHVHLPNESHAFAPVSREADNIASWDGIYLIVASFILAQRDLSNFRV